MRVLITPYSARSHAYNMVPLAWALRCSGHEVRVSCHPNEVDWVRASGLTAVAVGAEFDAAEHMLRPEVRDGIRHDIAEDRPDKLTWEYVHGVFEWYTSALLTHVTDDAVFDDMVSFARWWQPDLVIWDPLNFSGPVAARTCGAAHARLLFGQDFGARMRRVRTELARERQPDEQDDPLAAWLTRTLERYGHTFDESIVLGQWTIDPLPPRMRLDVDLHYVGMRYVPFNGPCALPEWLREPRKRQRVCLTLGFSGRELFGSDGLAIPELIEAMGRFDIEVIATLDARQLPPETQLSDNVRVTDFLPLNTLLPTCDVVVHHGGLTTTATAAASGTPQLVVFTKVWDKAAVARHVEHRGAGLALDSDQLTRAGFTSRLAQLLESPSFRAGAREFGHELAAMPSPSDIVAVLERLTKRFRVSV